MNCPLISRARPGRGWRGVVAGVLCAASLAAASAEPVTTLRPTELRADKLPTAPVSAPLEAGAEVRLLSLEGGWAWVEARGQRGWVRAGTLRFPASAAPASQLASGRLAGGNAAVALTVRELLPRSNRHALIISVSRYADAAYAPLPGARIDRESATQMALAMQVPASNIRYLLDEQASGAAIRQAVRDLDARVQDGDRVFIHFSGHGTRYAENGASECTEALLGYDGGWPGTLSHREMADLLAPITRKTDKLFVMYDACHSGGLVANRRAGAADRAWANANDEGRLRARFAVTTQQCAAPSNVRTRSLSDEVTGRGALPQDIVHLSAARADEISFEDENKGGLATQFMRDCLLREAKDLDGSGAVTIDEVRQCAQAKIEQRLRGDSQFLAHHLTLSGNRGFVPAWFSLAPPSQQQAGAPSTGVLAAVAATPPAPAKPAALPPAAPAAPAAIAPAPAPATVAAPTPLTGVQALQQLHDQRDAKRRVQVTLASGRLRIGQDRLALSVQSDRPGHVYVALAGSDNRSLHLLFPNALDADNRIEAGQQLLLPRPSWPVVAAGPAGTNHLLVMVADAPRDLSGLARADGSPFVSSLNDAQGRARLGALVTQSRAAGGMACLSAAGQSARPECSDAFGAALVAVEEVR
ncbi:caspase family protein [Ramlibacter sp. MAHUQ-53]|uniref:caspase family protein n=1 Tax=unclassified Ramlibacter TaxID=2617605 RepID=UPI0036254407